MMAVILFLSLILVSSGVNAQEIIDSSAFLDEGGLPNHYWRRLSLGERSGGVSRRQGRVTEQYCKHPSKGFERGRCCIDDASAQRSCQCSASIF